MLRVLPREGIGLRRRERSGCAARFASDRNAARHRLEHDPLNRGVTMRHANEFIMMRVLGIDPGFATCGLALLDEAGQRWQPTLLETIRTPPSWRLPARLHTVWRRVNEVIKDSKPTPGVLAVEAQARAQAGARARGQSSDDALAVREVMGLLRALAWQHGLAFVEVEPASWRGCLGLPRTADKAHVKRAVQGLLGCTGRLSQHAADAAGVAFAGARYFRSYARK